MEHNGADGDPDGSMGRVEINECDNVNLRRETNFTRSGE